jgi:hypothetical protein
VSDRCGNSVTKSSSSFKNLIPSSHLTSNGKTCRANAQRGKEICLFHDPAKLAAWRSARRRGGLNRSRAIAVLALKTPDSSLTSTREVCLFLGESINQLPRGQFEGNFANQGFLEERVSRIEATLGLEDTTGYLPICYLARGGVLPWRTIARPYQTAGRELPAKRHNANRFRD